MLSLFKLTYEILKYPSHPRYFFVVVLYTPLSQLIRFWLGISICELVYCQHGSFALTRKRVFRIQQR